MLRDATTRAGLAGTRSLWLRGRSTPWRLFVLWGGGRGPYRRQEIFNRMSPLQTCQEGPLPSVVSAEDSYLYEDGGKHQERSQQALGGRVSVMRRSEGAARKACAGGCGLAPAAKKSPEPLRE